MQKNCKLILIACNSAAAAAYDFLNAYLKEKIMPLKPPRSLGKPLTGDLTGFWRYRLGDYRILAKIEDEHFVILVIQV